MNKKTKQNLDYVKNIKYRGISLSFVVPFLIAMVGVFFIVMLVTLGRLTENYKTSNSLSETFAVCIDSCDSFQDTVDELTENARLFAFTGDTAYMEAYVREYDVVKTREKEIKVIRRSTTNSRLLTLMEEAYEYSNKAIEIELQSMHEACISYKIKEELIPEVVKNATVSDNVNLKTYSSIRERALNTLYADEHTNYHSEVKSRISEFIQIASYEQKTVTLALRDVYDGETRLLRAFVCINLGFFVVLAVVVLSMVRTIDHYINQINDNVVISEAGINELRKFARAYNTLYMSNRNKQETLSYCSEHDALTQIPNRHSFNQLTDELKDTNVRIAVVICDVDKFKTINDTYGHDVGDEVLKAVANSLSENFSSMGRVVRLGGDEFAVIIKNVSEKNILDIKHAIRMSNELMAKLKQEGLIPATRISAGCAFGCGYSTELYKNADTALYEAKNAPYDEKCVVFDEDNLIL